VVRSCHGCCCCGCCRCSSGIIATTYGRPLVARYRARRTECLLIAHPRCGGIKANTNTTGAVTTAFASPCPCRLLAVGCTRPGTTATIPIPIPIPIPGHPAISVGACLHIDCTHVHSRHATATATATATAAAAAAAAATAAAAAAAAAYRRPSPRCYAHAALNDRLRRQATTTAAQPIELEIHRGLEAVRVRVPVPVAPLGKLSGQRCQAVRADTGAYYCCCSYRSQRG
jgi:hypothetical protein